MLTMILKRILQLGDYALNKVITDSLEKNC